MDFSNLPPPHGGPLGDVWFRGLANPEHFLTALKEDFYILVVGCMMKYIRLEKAPRGLTYKSRVVRAFNHGVDGVSAIAGSQFRDVYALAEKRHKPRIFIFSIHKSDKQELEPHYVHSLKRIHSWDIRSMHFISQELFVVLTGFPTFNVVLFRWTSNEELMVSQTTEPTIFSRLLISPASPLHWVEYGESHMFVYEMRSLTRTDVVRTKINLPKRQVKYDQADPLMGRMLATKILSACWTIHDEFFVLDEQLGIHVYLPHSKVLQWTCSLTNTFLGAGVEQIVPFGDGLAAITEDGWFLNYQEIKQGGVLEVHTAYKLSSKVVRYIHFADTPDTFYAVTESKGAIEGVSHGMLRDPFAIPDLMFANIMCCCFIEPRSDYMAIVTQAGKVVILECDSGSPIAKWRLPFKVVGLGCHPVLPFLFCGTTYGCVNVLDIRNLKSPQLINRRFFTREPNPSIEKFGFVSQGKYVVSADCTNNRIFVQYGYPFMSYDFVDSAKVPAKISYISVPGCDRDDNRFQIFMSGKSKSDRGVVAYIINFSLKNDRLMVVASQTVDHPVTTVCLSPMPKYQYAYYPLKKSLGVVPFCDDNQWLNLQEPEHYIEAHFRHDITFMVFHGTKLYTFSEAGLIQVHEAPVIPKKKNLLPMVLQTLGKTHTHTYSLGGIRDGIVSLDGSQVIAMGHDGTFCRVRFFPKPAEPDWKTLGYERPRMIDYQIGTYLIDQEFLKSGEEFIDRIADIKVKIDVTDPVNFYVPGEEETDDEEEISPESEIPKTDTIGEKFKYGPKRSFRGTVATRKKIKKSDAPGETTESKDHLDTSEFESKRDRISEVVTGLEGTEEGTDGTTVADDEMSKETREKEEETPTSTPTAFHDDDEMAATFQPKTEVVMEPVPSALADSPSITESTTTSPAKLQDGTSSLVQKMISKVQESGVAPVPLTPAGDEPPKKKLFGKMHGAGGGGGGAPSALKQLLSEKMRKKGKAKQESDDSEKKEGEGQEAPKGSSQEEETTESSKKGQSDDDKKNQALSLVFGKKKRKKNADAAKSTTATKSKKKIKKFKGGGASKMLQKQATSEKLKAPPSRTARNKLGQAKLMKFIMEEEGKSTDDDIKRKTKLKSVKLKSEDKRREKSKMLPRESHQSEASRAMIIDADTKKDGTMSVLHDPGIVVLPEEQAKEYEGQDVSDVLTVEHGVRRKEFTEAEFFAQYEKTLLYRQHVPKAQSLRQEFIHFTQLVEELMTFNKQREEGNQVSLAEFNFDEDRELRLKEKAEKMKKIVHIQLTVRNKLRHARIKAMKHLVWEQFDTKGMVLMAFRKKLEVSNYPLLPEKDYFTGAISEGINWRRLEQRLEMEEEDAIKEANEHALRVLQHEMQFMSPQKKRLYMKNIMAIDPSVKFDDYEASDSDQSDEFFAKVFEELGLQLPDEGAPEGAPKPEVAQPKSKTGQIAQVAISTSKAASKFLQKGKSDKNNKASPNQAEDYVEKLKKMLLEEQEAEERAELYKPLTVESSVVQQDDNLKAQSRRDFMMNIKASQPYKQPTGLFGPKGPEAAGHIGGKRPNEVEVLMKPHAHEHKGKEISEVPSTPDATGHPAGDHPAPSKTKMRKVIHTKKRMKFKRAPDVVIDDETDLSGPEEEAVNGVVKKKFEMMDDLYRERYEMINNIFFGSNMMELMDMYQCQPAPFRYSQFDLGSRHELWRHHYIIMSEIYQLKKFFNKHFENLRNAKAYSLRKMSDRNERIREIYYYLKVNLDILDEKWHIQEDPSQIFTVRKEEMPVERYLTAEQRRLEEQKRLEDLARRRTRMAEFRKKALIVMMDNRLEVKREEILVNDIPKPPFMLEKDPLDYTLDEYLLSLQYAEAVEALEKARIEMIKELEEELGRLYRANAMEINTMDLRITELSIMKLQFHQNFQMEECRILRAIRQLRTMEDLDKEERRIAKIITELKSQMKTTQHVASQLETKRIICEEEIAKVAEQEKELERNFRRDLGDVGQYFEFFYKTYKKKPKISMKGLNKAEVYEQMVKALKADNIRTFGRENGEIGRVVVMSIYDLEDPLQKPKECSRSAWDKFNKVRRERLICEYQTKTLMAEIDRIAEAINECSKKENEGTTAIASVLGVISHKNDLKNYFVANTEFQMVLGKGQCEINCWNFKEHLGATIILIDNVEKLNQKIFAASEKLIKEMTKTAVVHRDIKEIEWRFLVVEMATKDLKKVQHDVVCFKPTKKLLEVLRRGINLDTMFTDRIKLVDYLRQTYIKYQKQFLKTKKKQLNMYKLQTHTKHDTNEEFKANIFEETEALVTSQINRVTPDMGGKSKKDTEKKAAQLLFRGYLNRKIIRLSNEIDKLEEELEKQYQKTFPIL